MLKLRERLTSLKLPYKVVSLKTFKSWSKEFNWQKRSLKKLCQEYANDMPKLITLKRWSKVFNWQKRSCPQVGQKFAISNNSIKKWSKAFNWIKRIDMQCYKQGKVLN